MTEPVVVCTFGGTSQAGQDETEAALTLGRRVGEALGCELRWLVLGSAPADLTEVASRHGVVAVDHAEDAKLDMVGPDARVEAVAQYAAEAQPRLLIFNQDFDSRRIAPRIAARIGATAVMNGLGIDVAETGGLHVTSAAYGGDTNVVYAPDPTRPCVVALMANAVVAEPAAGSAARPETQSVALDLAAVEERIEVLEPARTEGPRLEDAEIVVAGGRGLGSPENFKLVETLAETLGGMAAASRPLVDEGWIDSSRQVGLTGKITRPALYLAVGVSGATQHMAGCAAAKTIVAVNTDADAAIFRHARYGIVGDCLEILPELIRAAAQMGAG